MTRSDLFAHRMTGEIDTQRPEMGKPEEGNSFIAVVVGVYEKNDIGLSQLFCQGRAVLREGRGIDDRGRHIFGCTKSWRNGYLRQDGLDSVADEGILH